MTVINGSAISWADLKNALNLDGSAAMIIDTIGLSCPVANSSTVIEGSANNGNLVVQTASKATAHRRSYNKGVAIGKSAVIRKFDECCMYEANTEADIRLLEKYPSKEIFMTGQEKAQIAAMTEDFEESFFYGNSQIDISSFDGLATRYKTISTTKTNPGYQIVSCGGNTNLSSIYLVGWGDSGFNLFYPKGSKAGVDRIVNPQQRINDSDGNPLYAYCVNDNWQVGLTVQNYRQGGRIANIDMTALASYGSSSDTAPDLFRKVATLKNRIQHQNGFKFCWYCSENVFTILECMAKDKSNVMLSLAEQMGGMAQLLLNGWPVYLSDKISEDEDQVS